MHHWLRLGSFPALYSFLLLFSCATPINPNKAGGMEGGKHNSVAERQTMTVGYAYGVHFHYGTIIYICLSLYW